MVHGQLNRGVASPFQKGKGGKDDKKGEAKKGVRVVKSTLYTGLNAVSNWCTGKSLGGNEEMTLWHYRD